jgi:hypothetical protein
MRVSTPTPKNSRLVLTGIEDETITSLPVVKHCIRLLSAYFPSLLSSLHISRPVLSDRVSVERQQNKCMINNSHDGKQVCKHYPNAFPQNKQIAKM